MTLPKVYMNEIRKITGYWGTYLPSDRLVPGMVGRLTDGIFHQERMLSEYSGYDPKLHGAAKPQPSRSPVSIWQSDDVVAVSSEVKASAPGLPASGEVRFGFKKANNAVMICKGLRSQSFINLGNVRSLLHDLYEAKEWDPALCLITDVRLVKSAWICFATGGGQEAVVNATATIGLAMPPIDALKDAAAKGDLSTSWKASTQAGYKTEVDEGGTPLFMALQFKRTFPGIGPYKLSTNKGASEYFEEPEFGNSSSLG